MHSSSSPGLDKRGEKIAARRLHPAFLFYTGAYRRLIKRKLLTDLPFDPSLDQQEVIQFTFGSTSLCLAFKYAADISPLLSFFFYHGVATQIIMTGPFAVLSFCAVKLTPKVAEKISL